MVPIVQLVRASDCGSECRGFESHWAPEEEVERLPLFFYFAQIPADFEFRISFFKKSYKL